MDRKKEGRYCHSYSLKPHDFKIAALDCRSEGEKSACCPNSYYKLKIMLLHIPYSLNFSRIKYFAVLPNSAQKQIFEDKIFVV